MQNLSSHNLTEAEEKVLERGMNFAPTPKRIPKMDIVASVEAALLSQRTLKPEKAEQARATVTNLLANAQPPRQNVSKDEWLALKSLRQNESIVILEADKGNSTVVLDKVDYERVSPSLSSNMMG